MQHETIKTSAIFIATRGRTRVYRTLADVPPRLRKKLIRSTGSPDAATVLIADRRGAEELLRLEAPPPASGGLRRRRAAALRWVRRHWVELSFGLTVALLIRVLISVWS